MRTRIVVDSAEPTEVYDLTLAFQRTLGYTLPRQITNQPTVRVEGTRMGWTSPALLPAHATSLLKEFDRIRKTGPEGGDE